MLPPRGNSKETDFDLLCHLELEPEKVEKKGGPSADDEEEEDEEEANANAEIKYKSVVPRIQDYWLRTKPD